LWISPLFVCKDLRRLQFHAIELVPVKDDLLSVRVCGDVDDLPFGDPPEFEQVTTTSLGVDLLAA